MKKIRVEKKTSVRNSILRLALVAISIILQIVYILRFFNTFFYHTTEMNVGITIACTLVTLWIYGKESPSAMKTPWIIAILAFPIVGLTCYVLMGRSSLKNRIRKRFQEIDEEIDPLYFQDENVLKDLEKVDKSIKNQCYLTYSKGKYPVYQNTQMEYYDDASDGIEAQKQALRNAKKFIFMEYHAIEDAESFASIKAILKEKAAEGVEVRLFYDDVGSIGFINKDFIQRMESDGIQCRVFNPVMPFILVFMNNRDHRKITVIDGEVGFTGGYNLANEYFNITHPYGYWKDTGIKLTGDAVNSLTLIFLEMWNAVKHTDTDYAQYLVKHEKIENDGFIQPYADMPLDHLQLGEDVYMNIINNAKDYVYFVTPYLIITEEMQRALTLAAKKGVDVRIITPGIPDKKFTYAITRSYYRKLVKNGVRIFEYTPGFCHAKMCISDDEVATCGTINLDYRSLYHHFENGVYMYKCKDIQKMKEDFDDMFEKSNEVTEIYKKSINMVYRTYRAVLRLFAPLF